ncbi:RlpA-like double-psi beta-barrel-protein domain-containing protein-containing protein [Mycena leptocephala]|nr:RlpA-like double-psi beta-barrel-protein domain-containing protein-containing protein [Mycena leptocephala]
MQFTKSLASLATFVAIAVAITDRATFYTPEGEVGACGKVIQNSDLFVALSPDNYENGARCGEVFVVEHGTKGVTVEVGDICVACTGNQVDLTEGAFEILASLDEGKIEVTYEL